MSAISPLLPARLTHLWGGVWRPSAASMRRIALASVIANAGIIVTGGAVRVSQSGLGCDTWPRCTGDSLVPRPKPGAPAVHMAIEFGNRLLTFALLAVALACVVAALRLRPRRVDLVRLAWLQPLGIVAQVVVGGVSVLLTLHPATVSAHYLLSVAVLAAAVALHVRSGEGDGPARPLVRAEVRWLGRGLLVVVPALLAVGTVVTGTGPNAGDARAPRYGFSIDRVAQLHVDLVWITIGVTFALLLALRLVGAPRPLGRRAVELLVLELLQGVVGYAQYFLGDPPLLVGVHMLGSALVWIAVLRLVFAMRERVVTSGGVDGAAGRGADDVVAA